MKQEPKARSKRRTQNLSFRLKQNSVDASPDDKQEGKPGGFSEFALLPKDDVKAKRQHFRARNSSVVDPYAAATMDYPRTDHLHAASVTM